MRTKKLKSIPRSEAREATPEGVVAALECAIALVCDLAAQRREAKMSVARLAGLARELKELVKVMSAYGV